MAKNRLRIWSLYSTLALFVLLAGGFGVLVYTAQSTVPTSVTTKTPGATPAVAVAADKEVEDQEDMAPIPEAELYPNTKSMVIKDVTVRASVAQSWPERILGLSDTPYLPEDIVKLFVFDSAGMHSIWMKDMNYSIDIIWVDEAGKIVHLEENASPESYPAMFVPKTEARYVIETVAGFVAAKGIVTGDSVVLPTL